MLKVGKRRAGRFYRSQSRSAGRGDGTLAQKIYRMYEREIFKKCLPLTDEEWNGILTSLRSKPSIAERDKAVIHALLYAKSVANQYVGQGVPLLDLVQEANLALFDAVKKFDLSKSKRKSGKFVGYADSRIRSRLIVAIASFGGPLVVKQSDSMSKLGRFMEKFERRHHRRPLPEEIAEGLGMLKKRVAVICERMHFRENRSLNAPVGDNEGGKTALQIQLPDRSELSPEHSLVTREELKTSLEKIKRLFQSNTWNSFDTRDKLAVILRYGLDGTDRGLAFKKIGEILSLTSQRVHQIISRDWWKDLQLPPYARDGEKWLKREIEKIRELGDLIGWNVDLGTFLKKGVDWPEPTEDILRSLSKKRRRNRTFRGIPVKSGRSHAKAKT